MVLISINQKPSDKQVKSLGFIALVMCNVIGGMLLVSDKISVKAFMFLSLLGFVVYSLSWVFPKLIKLIYLILAFVTFPIGWLIGHLIISFVYYCIITPFALTFRFLGHDVLCRRHDSHADTYWISHKKRSDKDYLHQF
jgi:hypothetical protein